jgi:hypothetical protein
LIKVPSVYLQLMMQKKGQEAVVLLRWSLTIFLHLLLCRVTKEQCLQLLVV